MKSCTFNATAVWEVRLMHSRVNIWLKLMMMLHLWGSEATLSLKVIIWVYCLYSFAFLKYIRIFNAWWGSIGDKYLVNILYSTPIDRLLVVEIAWGLVEMLGNDRVIRCLLPWMNLCCILRVILSISMTYIYLCL